MDIAKRHVRVIYFQSKNAKIKQLTNTYQYDICYDEQGFPAYIIKQAQENYYATVGLRKPLFIRKGEIIYLSDKEKRELISAIQAVNSTERRVSDDKKYTS